MSPICRCGMRRPREEVTTGVPGAGELGPPPLLQPMTNKSETSDKNNCDENKYFSLLL